MLQSDSVLLAPQIQQLNCLSSGCLQVGLLITGLGIVKMG